MPALVRRHCLAPHGVFGGGIDALQWLDECASQLRHGRMWQVREDGRPGLVG